MIKMEITTLGPSLDSLAITHKSDKSSLYHNFCEKYDRLLSPHRDSFTNILEIGVARGQSLRMWTDYFPNATVHGIDIDPSSKECESYSRRMHVHTLDQGNEEQLRTMTPLAPFDLIVDDGNHWWREQIVSFLSLFPMVRSRGIYIIEDTCTSYWNEYKNYPVSCVDYFKCLVDKGNLSGARGRIPPNPSPEFKDWNKGWHRREDCHSNVPAFESIQFMNAIIVIQKR